MNDIEKLILFTEAVYHLQQYSYKNCIEEISSNTGDRLCQEDIAIVKVLVLLRALLAPPMTNWLNKFNEALHEFPVLLLRTEDGRKKLEQMCHTLASGEPV